MTNPKFKPYEPVWVMRNGNPERMLVFAVVQSMDISKTAIDIFYRLIKKSNPFVTTYNLVHGRCGAGWHADCGIVFDEKDIFSTKEDLLQAAIIRWNGVI